MKNIKKPTYDLKRILSARNMKPKDWGIKYEDSTKWIIVNRNTGEEQEIEK